MGASGPALPPAAIDRSDTGMSGRLARVSIRPFLRWMLSTTASVSPGWPR